MLDYTIEFQFYYIIQNWGVGGARQLKMKYVPETRGELQLELGKCPSLEIRSNEIPSSIHSCKLIQSNNRWTQLMNPSCSGSFIFPNKEVNMQMQKLGRGLSTVFVPSG